MNIVDVMKIVNIALIVLVGVILSGIIISWFSNRKK
tara:strand:+ start:547 stop:654 length:108 start_codon:yes stop_codon:yes gene_type:complete